MVKPDTAVLRALDALKNQQEFKVFLAWLSRSLEEERKFLEDAMVDCLIHRAQGSCKNIRTIIETIEHSRGSLERSVKTS